MRFTAAALAATAAPFLPPSASFAFSSRARFIDARSVAAFAPSSSFPPRPVVDGISSSLASARRAARRGFLFASSSSDGNDDEEDETGDDGGAKPSNPYSDPNYPELEFVDYSDPNYVIDQGLVGDELYGPGTTPDDTEEQIEAMREDRRRRNDEFQFETYHESVLRGGDEYFGEWTVYKTVPAPTPSEGDEGGGGGGGGGIPGMRKVDEILKTITSGKKVFVESDSEYRVDGERLVHVERTVTSDGKRGGDEVYEAVEEVYWPERMKAFDFRGEQGNMCVGAGYTVCSSVPLGKGRAGEDGDGDGDGDSDASEEEENEDHSGPFEEYRAEVGIHSDDSRFRVKLDYRVDEFVGGDETHPPLRLKTMTVCREARGAWPTDDSHGSLFSPPGAPGGLYDPPPVGSDEQAARYMLLDLVGGATVLFPYMLDQDPDAFDGNGWVTSLDWTPAAIRYQVDRKVWGGTKLKGLRTLELSEVQGSNADEWRPKDGGEDMRQ